MVFILNKDLCKVPLPSTMQSQKNSGYLSPGYSTLSIMSLVSFEPIKNIFKEEVSVELLSEEQ